MSEITWYEGPDIWAGTQIRFNKRGSAELLDVFLDADHKIPAPNPIEVGEGGLPRIYFEGGAEVTFLRFGEIAAIESVGI